MRTRFKDVEKGDYDPGRAAGMAMAMAREREREGLGGKKGGRSRRRVITRRISRARSTRE